MKKNVAVVYGGNSSEWEISVKSGKQVSQNIDRSRYNVFDVLIRGAEWVLQQSGKPDVAIDKNDFSVMIDGVKNRFDCAFIVIHGTPGEDGLLQSYFELLGIPYTSCSAFVATLTMNKYATKCFLRDSGVWLAKEHFCRKGHPVDFDELERRLGLPVFVKPNNSGSSYGVTKVKLVKDFPRAFDDAFAESDEVIVEEYIAGRELQQGVYRANGQTVLLPVTEIISQNEFFDYEAKYEGKSAEITPAEISAELAAQIGKKSELIYNYLGCKGVVRIDYIVRNEKEIYFLEINTIPGMSEASIVPQQIRAAGMTLAETYSLLIEESLKKN